MESGRRSAGDVILAEAAEEGADLLVMGGYGHSKLREALLGGATRTLLGRRAPSGAALALTAAGAALPEARAAPIRTDIRRSLEETAMTDFFATHFAFITSPEGWAAMVTLVAMEVVLGIDNLIFISILTNKLPRRAPRRRRGGSASAPR